MSENPYESPQTPQPQKPPSPILGGVLLFVVLGILALLIAIVGVCATS